MNDRTAGETPRPPERRFADAYEAVAPALFAWARLRIGPELSARIDPDDIVQEVCFRAWTRFADFDPDRGTFRGWLFGIANNVLRESLMKLPRRSARDAESPSGRLPVEALPDEATSISRRVARNEVLRAFVDRLAELSETDRRLLIYRGLEGLRHQAVADLLGASVDAVEKRWQRLLQRLDDGTLSSDLFVR